MAMDGIEKVLIVGIGSESHGDDAAGIKLIRTIKPGEGVGILEAGTIPESLLYAIREAEPDLVILADAVDFGRQPGEIAVLDRGALVHHASPTTHRAPLDLLMRYIEEEIGATALLLGIQPGRVGPDLEMAEEVKSSVLSLAELLSGRSAADVALVCRELRPLAAASGIRNG